MRRPFVELRQRQSMTTEAYRSRPFFVAAGWIQGRQCLGQRPETAHCSQRLLPPGTAAWLRSARRQRGSSPDAAGPGPCCRFRSRHGCRPALPDFKAATVSAELRKVPDGFLREGIDRSLLFGDASPVATGTGRLRFEGLPFLAFGFCATAWRGQPCLLFFLELTQYCFTAPDSRSSCRRLAMAVAVLADTRVPMPSPSFSVTWALP